MASEEQLERRDSSKKETPKADIATKRVTEASAVTDTLNSTGANMSPLQAGIKGVTLLILTGLYSPISQLSLSPVYGSIPPSIYHLKMTMTAILISLLAKHLYQKNIPANTAKLIPLLAFLIPTIQSYLFPYSGKLGPVYGPLITELLTYFPLIILSVYQACLLLENIDLGQEEERFVGVGPGIAAYAVFKVTQKISTPLIRQWIGSNFIFTRAHLQLVMTGLYALVLPSRLSFLAVFSILNTIGSNYRGTTESFDVPLNATYHALNGSLVARKESLTGYISVLDNTRDQFRVMRCDHSLLGGEWLVPTTSQARVKEPIYTVFIMLEAVRLVEANKRVVVPDDQTNALVIGLGIGTTPSALIAHGVHTTIVEIDPVVHEYASLYFDLPQNHTSVIEDATSFVRKAQAAGPEHYSYDYIVHDVFTGGAEPADLFTQEFIQGLSNLLKSDGVIAINYAGDLFLPSASLVVKTVKSVFPTCRLFREDAPGGEAPIKSAAKHDFTNMVIFCGKYTESFTFRDPVESDFLGTQSRQHYLKPKYEIPADYFENRSGFADLDILKKGHTKELEKSQVTSAVGHWRLMRTVLPDAVWENW